MQVPLPPTPTLLPAPVSGTVVIEIPDMTLWDLAPDAIQAWNSASAATVIFQGMLLIGLILALLMMIYRKLSGYLQETRE